MASNRTYSEEQTNSLVFFQEQSDEMTPASSSNVMKSNSLSGAEKAISLNVENNPDDDSFWIKEFGIDSAYLEEQSFIMDTEPPELNVTPSFIEDVAAPSSSEVPPVHPDELFEPGKENSRVSSSLVHTPRNRQGSLPFYSCNESPIDTCVVTASTPFHGRHIASNSSAVLIDCIEKVALDLGAEDSCEQPFPKTNGTFMASHISVAENATFNMKEGENLTFFKEENQTFDAPPAMEKDSGSDIMDSCNRLESSEESVDVQNQKNRKPLTALPQPKATNSSRTGIKHASKLAAPRMNTAAMSRILARSPGNKETKDSNTQFMKPPPTRALKKPTITRARKSLLPPPNIAAKKSGLQPPTVTKSTQVRKPKGSSIDSTMKDGDAKHQTKMNCTTPTKRKAPESPKRKVPSPKISGAAKTLQPRPIPVTNRSSSATRSRTASGSLQRQLQRPSSRAQSATSTRLSSNSTSATSSTKSFSKTTRNVKPAFNNAAQKNISSDSASSILTSTGNLRKPKAEVNNKNLTKTNCVTALAILLDHVVNNLDGLSSPRLSKDNEHLRKVITDNKDANVILTTRLADFENRLATAIASHATEIHLERSSREEIVSQLTSEIENERQKHQQEIGEMTTNHEMYIIQLRNEWTEEQEKLETELKSLCENMENKIHDEVEERIKPYVNAKQEVESLTAVLDMKLELIRKLEAHASQYNMQRDEASTLQFKLDQMKQKNEDLSMQLQEKMRESRNNTTEFEKLRRSVTEGEMKSVKLHQQNEELMYRLNSLSPSSPSFNPVFTTSPTMTDPPSAYGSTPINRFKRTTFSQISPDGEGPTSRSNLTRTLSYNNNDGEGDINHSP